MKALWHLDQIMRRFEWVPNWTIFAAIIIVIVQAADRKPPFELIAVHPAVTRPGETVTIFADVWRDHSRECSVDVHRSLHDAKGRRWDYPSAHFSYDSIALTEARTPGRMAPMFEIPSSVVPGPAEITTALEYRCNKTHAIWPIELTHTLPFTVVP